MSVFPEWMSLLNSSTVLIFFLTLTIVVYLASLTAKHNLPPGPINLPIVGHVPFMLGKRLEDAIYDLKKKYGDIIYVQLGAKRAVLLCSYKTINEALQLNNDTATTRSHDFSALNHLFSNTGILIDNGKIWQQQRKFLTRALRELGSGTGNLETQIRDEAIVLTNELHKQVGQPFDIHQLLINASANIMSAFIFGYRYKYGDPAFKELLYMFYEVPTTTSPFKPVNSFPYIRFFLPGFLSGMAEVDESKNLLNKFLDQKIAEHIKSGDTTSNYANIVLQKQKEYRDQGSVNDALSHERLRSNTLLLNVAGISTTAATIYWAFKMTIVHEDIQQKLHNEIDKVIGSERTPSYSDKLHMPLTEAFLMEVQRFADVVPISPPRSTNKAGTKIAGYDIPPETIIMSCSFLTHQDEKIWGDPQNFRPERFIDKDGKLQRSQYLIPFSTGKRSCPGENLALTEIFVLFTTILQNFFIHPASASDTKMCVNEISFTRDVSNYKVILQPRQPTKI